MTHQYPELYARNSNGSIQEWQIEVEGNKYRTVVGRQGGAKITSAWTVCTGKNKGQRNETTDAQQAIVEADAKWKKKLKSGGYFEDIKDIDNSLSFVEPMLAHRFVDHQDKVQLPCMVDKKYNGGRVIAVQTGLWTRKGERYMSIPHIEDILAPFFEKYPNLVLDGEGYNHDLRFKLNETMSIIRTTKEAKITPELLSKSESTVRLYVYDGYGFEGITENTGCLARRKALAELLHKVPYIVNVPYRIANTLEEIDAIYADDVSEGYEGSIIRNIHAPYEHKRSYNLLKVKPTDDDEFVIVDINEGSGNWSGTGKIITFRMKNGKKFNGTFKGSMPEGRKFLLEKDKWIGQTVTVFYNGFTGLGIPNSAQFDINNCLKNDR